jgi:hypothetical protein
MRTDRSDSCDLVRCWVRSVLACGTLVLSTAPAQAGPRLLLERCVAFDRTELLRDVKRELAVLPAATADRWVVSLICDDAVTAIVRVESQDSRQIAERAVDLGEVSSDLRPRLIGVVAASLIEAVLAAPASVQDTTAVTAAPSEDDVRPPAREIAPAVMSTVALARGPTSPGAVSKPREVRLALTTGARLYVESPRPLLQLGAEIDLGFLAVGLVAAVSTGVAPEVGGPYYFTGDERFHPYLGAVSLRRALGCRRGRGNELCLHLRLEGGLTVVTVELSRPDRGFGPELGRFAAATVAFEARRQIRAVDAGLWLEVGWSEGTTAHIPGDTLVSFGGVVAMTHLGLRWRL